MARKTRGRQKINMVKMENESNLQVTFSKRRSGLFKKASELCTLCGTEMALIVFSPGDKVFSFGHPSVEAVLDRFLSGNPNPNPNPLTVERALVEAHRSAKVRELNGRLTEVMGMVEEERKVGREGWRRGRGRPWWEGEVEEMGLEQLEELKGAMVELKRDVAKQVEKMIMASMDHQVEASARVLPFSVGYGVVPFAAGGGGSGGGAGGSSSSSGGGGRTLRLPLPLPPPLSTHGFNHGFF